MEDLISQTRLISGLFYSKNQIEVSWNSTFGKLWGWVYFSRFLGFGDM